MLKKIEIELRQETMRPRVTCRLVMAVEDPCFERDDGKPHCGRMCTYAYLPLDAGRDRIDETKTAVLGLLLDTIRRMAEGEGSPEGVANDVGPCASREDWERLGAQSETVSDTYEERWEEYQYSYTITRIGVGPFTLERRGGDAWLLTGDGKLETIYRNVSSAGLARLVAMCRIRSHLPLSPEDRLVLSCCDNGRVVDVDLSEQE